MKVRFFYSFLFTDTVYVSKYGNEDTNPIMIETKTVKPETVLFTEIIFLVEFFLTHSAHLTI